MRSKESNLTNSLTKFILSSFIGSEKQKRNNMNNNKYSNIFQTTKKWSVLPSSRIVHLFVEHGHERQPNQMCGNMENLKFKEIE